MIKELPSAAARRELHRPLEQRAWEPDVSSVCTFLHTFPHRFLQLLPFLHTRRESYSDAGRRPASRKLTGIQIIQQNKIRPIHVYI